MGKLRFYSTDRRDSLSYPPPQTRPRQREQVPEREFWQINEAIKKKRQELPKDQVHFVFLEGPGGTGKKDLLWRLDKFGYHSIPFPYLPFVIEQHLPIRQHKDKLNAKWVAMMLESIQRINSNAKEGKKFKQDVVFVLRSPLSVYIHEKVDQGASALDSLQLTQRLKKELSCTFILCKTDPIKLQERLAERYFMASHAEQAVREALGEGSGERMLRLAAAYENFLPPHERLRGTETDSDVSQDHDQPNEPAVLDACIHTTSTKQGTAQLLKVLDIAMEWPKFGEEINFNAERVP